MISIENIPDDVDGDVLRRMRANGDSLTQSRPINFSVLFPTQDAARRFCDVMEDYDVAVTCESLDDDWDVTVTRDMVPDHAAITGMEHWITIHAEPLGGGNDGWGCFNMEDLRDS